MNELEGEAYDAAMDSMTRSQQNKLLKGVAYVDEQVGRKLERVQASQQKAQQRKEHKWYVWVLLILLKIIAMMFIIYGKLSLWVGEALESLYEDLS